MENPDVEAVREREYPHMNNGTYLDHGGATIYTKSAVEAFTRKMVTNLYGNPHSENSPAKLSGNVVDEVREKTLHFLGADPEHYDLVFVANATAAIKLVADSFSDLAEKSRTRRFWYGYHYDAHTSLVGVRELARSYCFESDGDVEAWLDFPRVSLSVDRHHSEELGLFAYPAQSNMSGKRLPLGWSGRVRDAKHLQNTYTLLDAAAFAMTSPMELVFQDVAYAPDFTCLSLYKIFGFPDIGALVVRRDSGHILTLRKYFGGGTVTNVSAIGETWYRSKGLQGPTYKLHEGLEDGTLPFHSILALGEAIDVHGQLYKSMSRVSEHTSFLVSRLYRGLTELSHGNGRAVVKVYSEPGTAFDDPRTQGSVVAFNVLTEDGGYVPYTEVERRANDRGIYIRSGGESKFFRFAFFLFSPFFWDVGDCKGKKGWLTSPSGV
ncbi:pyridoxal phosphate-dependent transferase [Pseudomassariella vexata]|uniref:Pyridoxal phosphate-dependent transferase n=1 Tax=Pseudomassariella vexata TaxID=1141098 RepID=A0A1Y2E442_9PEZI|nr:pyridoxal phosphate-dependent transferase [Pseudomassariella vexata]ORY66328.1 pyridoxal phosphate-dependent transferase [Pseudomassariella vexata]